MKRVIKKYNNRKLYDTEQSRYVGMSEIAKMLEQGIDVVVVDQKTKVDVTGVQLAQVVLADEKQFYATSAVEKLKQILSLGGFKQYSESFKK